MDNNNNNSAIATEAQDLEQAVKKEKDAPKPKRTRRHFRQQAKRLQTVDGDAPRDDASPPNHQDDVTASRLTPTDILELFHTQDDEVSSLSSRVGSARYVVENGASGDFYQVRMKQRRRGTLAGHGGSLPPSLLKLQRLRWMRDHHETDEQRWSWRKVTNDSEKTLVLLGLGGVAGMCWMEALNVNTGISVTSFSTTGGFACTYSAAANRSRQLFFVLFKYPPYVITPTAL